MKGNKIIKMDPPVTFQPLGSVMSFNAMANANQPLWVKEAVLITPIKSQANDVVSAINSYTLASATWSKCNFLLTPTPSDENKNIRNTQVVRQCCRKAKQQTSLILTADTVTKASKIHSKTKITNASPPKTHLK